MSRILLLLVALALAVVVVDASNSWLVTVGSNGTFAFSPQTLSIMPGDTVAWRFDGGPHTVTQSTCAKSCQSISPPGFDSSQMMLGGNFAITFNNTGKIWYYCTVGTHCSSKGMYGTLLVGVPDDTTNSTDGSSANSTANSTATGAASSGRGSTHVAAVTAAVLLSSMVVAGFLL